MKDDNEYVVSNNRIVLTSISRCQFTSTHAAELAFLALCDRMAK
jgi:hypothetical protein